MNKNESQSLQNKYPLWIKYPHIPKGSIGWRMGYGESYADEFYDWFNCLNQVEQQEYKNRFPKPICWTLDDNDMMSHNDYWTFNWKRAKFYSTKDYIDNDINNETLEFLYFWGHTPSKDGKVNKECFSQWYRRNFQIGHETYCCMEQYMMEQKALLFGDSEIAEQIINSSDPSKIKNLGRKVSNFEESIWNQFKLPIVMTGNYYKFVQNPDLMHVLLSTKDMILVEASMYDCIWGIGMGKDEAEASSVNLWRGSNLLGFGLMTVRDEIKRVWGNVNIK